MAKVSVDPDAPTRVRWLVQVQVPGGGPVGTEVTLPLRVAAQYTLLEWAEPAEQPLGDAELATGVMPAFRHMDARRAARGAEAFDRVPANERIFVRLEEIATRVGREALAASA